MKTLVLYTTKSGATKKIAQSIASRIEGASIYDLKQSEVPSLEGFDCVIVGSPVYVGMIRKEAKEYITKNADILCDKKLGLFISGMDVSKEKEYFNNNFPVEIMRAAKAVSFLGGIFDPKKAGVMGRLVMKAVSKQAEYMDTIDSSEVDRFVLLMKS